MIAPSRSVSVARSCGSVKSPAEDFFFDPALHVLPRLELDRSGLDIANAAFDLDGSRGLCTGIRRDTIFVRPRSGW